MSTLRTAPSSDSRDGEGLSLRKIVIAGLITIGLFFGGLGGWAATAELSGAVIAPGEIIVESYRQQVQHLSGGIVESILVREGDWVEKGQILIRLDGERALATRDLHRARMDALQAQQARLVAAIDDADRIDWPEALLERAQAPEHADLAEALASEKRIFRANLAARDSQEALHRGQIRQQQRMLAGLKRQETAIEDMNASLSEEIVSKRGLLDAGHIQRTHIMELERSLNSLQAQLEEIRTDMGQAEESIATLELQIKDLHKRYAQTAATELGKVRQAIADLREQLRPAEDDVRRLDIRAPAGGVVVNLHVRTEGGVIRGGEPLMEIVPQEGALIVSARVPTKDIDSVDRGQPAKVALSAFSSRSTPKVNGEVSYVSADRIEPKNQSEAQMPYYLVYVQLDQDSLQQALGDTTRLNPGMPAEVFIQTEQRTMLSYIMSPISDSLGRAFRE